jgi:hypothetical protein
MLHQRDYLLRLIEQLARVLAQLLDRVLNHPPEELAATEAELNEIAQRVGLDLELARRLDADSLAIMIAPAGSVDPARCWLLAELLYLHGLQAERRGMSEVAMQSFARSLHLYAQVQPSWRASVPLPEATARRAELEERIAPSE